MGRNGHQHPARPRIEVSAGSASPEETAAIAAAIEQFMRDTAPAPSATDEGMNPWLRAGLLEATGGGQSGMARWSARAPW